MEIRPGDLSDPRIADLLHTHLARALAVTPRKSAHALDLAGLAARDISLWAAWDGDRLAGVGALRAIAPDHGEVKSMHTAEALRGRGAGTAMLRHIVAEATARGYARLSLETGAMDYFAPARALYRRHGFVPCGPFAGYAADPNSRFMALALPRRGAG